MYVGRSNLGNIKIVLFCYVALLFLSLLFRTRLCLADFKELMLDFGLIDDDDDNVKFYMDIIEVLQDPDEQ